ncbi:MAG: hypothetical protein KDD50_00360 [Bdellovibrionales bacterium]|nr:hypothetical protein [Bdellovibrionales bacterium]
MSKIFKDLKVELDEDLREKLLLLEPQLHDFHILKQSIDARKKGKPHFVFSIEVFSQDESIPAPQFSLEKISSPPHDLVNIIGAGPGGLFAAIRLLERGIPCRLFERGSQTEQRLKHITRFWRYGELNAHNNVCFGEGGAGLYSDGKLITRIKSPHISYVMHKLVEFGAPQEITYLANPHVGSDKIRRIIPKLREYIAQLGGEILFDHPVEKLLIEGHSAIGVIAKNQEFLSPYNILATGHSARDIFFTLHEQGITLENKDFAMGLRVEHSQEAINKIQYREHYKHPKLSAANYKLAYHDHKSEVGIYSFCMCPGGYVLSSGTDPSGLVCNGMSNYKRNSPHANSAVVVTIKNSPDKPLFYGLEKQKQLEERAFEFVQQAGGTKQLPAQKMIDFLNGKRSENLPKSSCPSGVISVDFNQLLPSFIARELKKGFLDFEKKMKGFVTPEALLIGVESRTSSPLRIPRGKKTFASLSHSGLYPCGEGAGYAGGITSAACDGIQIAESIYRRLNEINQATD